MDIRKIVVGILRQVVRAVAAFLSTIPAGWLVVMGIVAVPIAILSAVVAIVFFILLALLALLGLLFYVLIWRPVVRTTRRQEKVIEAEYSVKSEDDK